MTRLRIRAIAAVLCLLAGPALGAGCEPGVLDLRDDDSVLRFKAEIADTGAERSRGLMHRDSLPRMSGMLFVYPDAGAVSFWMRNTLIPLDMLFFDETGTLQKVHANARPLDETSIPGGEAIRYVFEINGGLAETFGIEPGAELRSPAIDQDLAAWPCE